MQYRRNQAAKFREIIRAAKDCPCVDCGVQYPTACMDLDHVRGTKEFMISHHSASYARIAEEIAKCDVRCANCHRLRHHNENATHDLEQARL